MRLDKFIATSTELSRKDVKKAIAKGRVLVNGEIAKSPELTVVESDEIIIDGETTAYQEFEYFMLNKPAGVVSATTDNFHSTVVELLAGKAKKDVFPMGRLDIDTEGLLILTNDGELSHRLLSPKYHVDKTYFVRVDKELGEEDVKAFSEGMDIGEKKKTQPAKLVLLSEKEAEVTIHEGKFHQIKRMFLHQGKTVVCLKRISMGDLVLDKDLKPGEFRELTSEEVQILKNSARNICKKKK